MEAESSRLRALVSSCILSSGEVLALQHCVDAKFETSHRVPKENWYWKLNSLLGRWEPTEVSDHLEERWKGCFKERNAIRKTDHQCLDFFPFPSLKSLPVSAIKTAFCFCFSKEAGVASVLQMEQKDVFFVDTGSVL